MAEQLFSLFNKAKEAFWQIQQDPGHSQPQTMPRPPPASLPSNRFLAEGVMVSHNMWNHFWDAEQHHFRTPKKGAETLDEWNGYTLWPFIIGIEALLLAEETSPGSFTQEIITSLEALHDFYSPERRSYCAWLYSPDNKDIYYDDNAQVAITFLKASTLPSLSQYRDSFLSAAEGVIDFLATGWCEENGGMEWHVDKDVRNACTTALSAVAALQLVVLLRERNEREDKAIHLIKFARKCVDWLTSTLLNDRGLVLDEADKGGPTYTYNTGQTLQALCMLHKLSPTTPYTEQAHSLILAAIDRNNGLFDCNTRDPERRYYWDNTFFLHLLFEGFNSFIEVFGDKHPGVCAQVREEVSRHVEYLMRYTRDPADGLYWRNLRLYRISHGHSEAYREVTGEERACEPDEAERVQDDENMERPVGNREMAKTLLGCGGVARCFLLAGKIVD